MLPSIFPRSGMRFPRDEKELDFPPTPAFMLKLPCVTLVFFCFDEGRLPLINEPSWSYTISEFILFFKPSVLTPPSGFRSRPRAIFLLFCYAAAPPPPWPNPEPVRFPLPGMLNMF